MVPIHVTLNEQALSTAYMVFFDKEHLDIYCILDPGRSTWEFDPIQLQGKSVYCVLRNRAGGPPLYCANATLTDWRVKQNQGEREFSASFTLSPA